MRLASSSDTEPLPALPILRGLDLGIAMNATKGPVPLRSNAVDTAICTKPGGDLALRISKFRSQALSKDEVKIVRMLLV